MSIIKRFSLLILSLCWSANYGICQYQIQADSSNIFSTHAMREMSMQVDSVIRNTLSEAELDRIFKENKKNKKNAILLKLSFKKTGVVDTRKSIVSLYGESTIVSKDTLKKIKKALLNHQYKIFIHDEYGDGYMTRLQFLKRYGGYPSYSILYPTSIICE